MLKLIKVLHTFIWCIMFSSVVYVFYSGITGIVTYWSWMGVVLIFIEGVALMTNKFTCPLHSVAIKIAGKNILNDTFLPSWIFFKDDKLVYSLFFFVGLLLMLLRTFMPLVRVN